MTLKLQKLQAKLDKCVKEKKFLDDVRILDFLERSMRLLCY